MATKKTSPTEKAAAKRAPAKRTSGKAQARNKEGDARGKINIFNGLSSLNDPTVDFNTQTGTLVVAYEPLNTADPISSGGNARSMLVRITRRGRVTTLSLKE
jgi:hypothetical protein